MQYKQEIVEINKRTQQLQVQVDALAKDIKDKEERIKEKADVIELMGEKLKVLEKEKRIWNIVVDQHGEEIDVNMDKLLILDA